MDSVLVVQMARMGDFMQTTPLLKGFQKERRVAVLVDKRISDIARKCSCSDEVIEVDMETVFSIINRSGSADKQFAGLREVFDDLRTMYFDTVFNVNRSFLSAVLSAIPKSRNILGYRLDHKTSDMDTDTWFVLLSRMVKYRPLAPFNLADSFYYAAHKPDRHPLSLSYQLKNSERNKASLLLAQHGIQAGDKVIALQIGANSPGRQWHPDCFAALAAKLLDSNAVVLLLGSGQERGAAEIIKKRVKEKTPNLYNRLIDLAGRTQISDIAPVLSQCSALVTCDTGPMHIAAAVGCRVIALFFGPAHLLETGPYGEGHLVIQSDINCCPCMDSGRCRYDHVCSRKIDHETVFNVVKSTMYGQRLKEPLSRDVCIYLSGIDEWGVFYSPVFKKTLSTVDLQNLCYREMSKCLVDFEYETSINISSHFVEDERYIEDEVKKLKSLIYSYYKYPLSVETALFDPEYAFWHPWLEWYRDVRQMGEKRAGEMFVKGLQNGLSVLRKAEGKEIQASSFKIQ